MSKAAPMKEDFAALLEESYLTNDLAEGTVVKGVIIAIEKDMVVIDAGLKVEGRVALKEFGIKGRDGGLKPGDTVDIYVERIENALGEAVLSRDKARREESWVKLEEKFAKAERVDGIIFAVVKGGFTVDLDGKNAAANKAALAAPASPMAKVATGTPLGICTMESSESIPFK